MRGVLLGGGGYTLRGQPTHVLARVDLDHPARGVMSFSMRFLPHGFAFDPSRSSRVAVFEKKGPGACVIDVTTGVIERELASGEGRHFYGHGAFSPDATLLYATESVLTEGGRGELVVRDAKTLEHLGALSTHGFSPHDCVLLDDGKTMVVANGGGAIGVRGSSLPCVTYIEFATGKLLEKIPLPSPTINAGHVAVSKRGDLVIVSAPRDGVEGGDVAQGAVTLRLAKRKPFVIERPRELVARMIGETLSVAIDAESTLALTTHPLGDCVSAWSLADGSSRGVLELPVARGVALTLDGREFVVSHKHGDAMALSFFDARTLEATGERIAPSPVTGSHVVIHRLDAAQTAHDAR
ncbi:MAG: DUF1513 domain-containing protein [Polyangiales bacterium]